MSSEKYFNFQLAQVENHTNELNLLKKYYHCAKSQFKTLPKKDLKSFSNFVDDEEEFTYKFSEWFDENWSKFKKAFQSQNLKNPYDEEESDEYAQWMIEAAVKDVISE